ncbi:MAG: hypothetical protein MK297_11065 [Planctomycetes bacterium]|nr:hypothetical protein [Planctomycetota bacterium]
MDSMNVDAASEDVRDEMNDAEGSAEQATYSGPDDYREKTGKRFRMTKAQKERGLSREEAFAEFIGAEVEPAAVEESVQEEDPIVFAAAPEEEDSLEEVEPEVQDAPAEAASESAEDDEEYDDEEDEEAWLELRGDLATLAKNDARRGLREPHVRADGRGP